MEILKRMEAIRTAEDKINFSGMFGTELLNTPKTEDGKLRKLKLRK